MQPLKITYIVSDIDKALAFEWISLQLDKTKFELHFVLLNQGDSSLERFLHENQIPTYRVYCKSKKDWPLAWTKLVQILRKIRPDVVHCHLLQANILGLTAAKFTGIPKRIYTRHHSDYHFRYFPKGVKWDKLSNWLATDIIAPSNAVVDVLIHREQVKEGKINLIPHGFDLKYFHEVSEEAKDEFRIKYNPCNQFPVVGVISRFTELKGIQYIIPAFKKLLINYPEALLLLFNAKGDYSYQINNLLKELPEKNFKTIDFEPNLSQVYSLFDVFIQASTDTTIEAFGQTYVEALAAGIPSVFTLSGIAADFIVDTENALVVPFKDEKAIYEAVFTILNHEEIRKKIILGGWKSVQVRFSIQEMINNLSRLYLSNKNVN